MKRTGYGAESIVIDDFKLQSGGTIRTVLWQGIYCLSPYMAPPAPTATATSFDIAFYAEHGGFIDYPALQNATYTIADVNQQLERNTTSRCADGTPGAPTGLYNYSVRLNAPFVAASGTNYWISIKAALPGNGASWGWRVGSSTNKYAIWDGGGGVTVPHDFAFALR